MDVSEVSSEMGARWRDQICDDGLDTPKFLCDEVSETPCSVAFGLELGWLDSIDEFGLSEKNKLWF